jgi:hypothetical protein
MTNERRRRMTKDLTPMKRRITSSKRRTSLATDTRKRAKNRGLVTM